MITPIRLTPEYVFCDTGWESPITYAFIDRVNRRLLGERLIVLRSAKYDSLLDIGRQFKRFPSPRARFCTQKLKIVPMIEWILQQQCDIAVYQGIRAQESITRARMRQSDDFFSYQISHDRDPYRLVKGKWQRASTPIFQKPVMEWLESYDCSVERPFFHWKTQDVLTLCRKHNVLNPLYDMGFSRVGCFPCIMSRKQEIRQIAQDYPSRIDMIEQAEKDAQSTFFSYYKVPPSFCKEPRIRDVVKWACSDVKEYTEGNMSCMSHYHQCE